VGLSLKSCSVFGINGLGISFHNVIEYLATLMVQARPLNVSNKAGKVPLSLWLRILCQMWPMLPEATLVCPAFTSPRGKDSVTSCRNVEPKVDLRDVCMLLYLTVFQHTNWFTGLIWDRIICCCADRVRICLPTWVLFPLSCCAATELPFILLMNILLTDDATGVYQVLVQLNSWT